MSAFTRAATTLGVLSLSGLNTIASDFVKEIQPILEVACVRCHNPEKTKGKLQLHTREAAFKGGKSGPAIVPGKPDESEFITRISLPHDDDDIMPHESDPLSNPQIGILRDWVEAGAPWPEDAVLVQSKPGEKTMAAATAASAIPIGAPRDITDAAARVEQILKIENADKKGVIYAEPINDLAFLRKITIDLVGRIPRSEEITEYKAWPTSTRRLQLVEKLSAHPRFNERWTVFFADMLRIRSNAPGGSQMLAYVHRAIAEATPYDKLVRELVSANGRSGKNAAVGFVLGDDVDPMALAGACSQIFLGVRLACAECHDHPYDDWKQQDFYDLAGFFGKTKKVENRFARSIYTTEGHEMAVQWPPERDNPKKRSPVRPRFPFKLVSFDQKPEFIQRFDKLRSKEDAVAKRTDPSAAIDDLLDIDADKGASDGFGALDLLAEAQKESAALDVESDLYRPSELRTKLAGMITDPRNPYFARAFTNRVWAELVGRGFVEPLDNFSDYNGITNPQTLNFLAREFVASGYDLRTLIKTITLSAAYSRNQLGAVADVSQKEISESNFASTPLRRMLSEVLFDSIVIAGHLQEQKWPNGANVRTVERQIRVPIEDDEMTDDKDAPKPAPQIAKTDPKMMAAKMDSSKAGTAGYDLEQGIGLDFAAILRKAEMEASGLTDMKKMSDEQIEARKMAAAMKQTENRPMRYRIETIAEKIDDNPRFDSSMRMASPAPPSHFLRVFGQPSRTGLGEFRDESPSLRQALMMLNGKATHEAARVGPLEPLHSVMQSADGDYSAAIDLAYAEILTRKPDTDELADAKSILATAASPSEGMADLRWALLNCHEFRFLP